MAYVESITAKNETRTIRDLNGQQMLATVQASTTASKAYAVGDYLILNDKLYKVTTAIASGGTITVGTNVEEAKVGTELTELNRQISESITPAIEEIETALDGKAPAIYETVSGEIASFADGADSMPVKSLIANIEPVQDLHGYANPWPGGGSKNKLNLVAVFNGQGSYSADGSVYTLDSIGERPLVQFAETDGNYILTWDNTAYSGTATNVRLEFYNSAGTLVTSRYCTEATPYTINGVCKVKANYSNNGTLSIKNPMIRLATETDATFAPYSNICPISGHTGASVTRTGKNLFDEEVEKGYYWNSKGTKVEHSGRSCSKNFIPVKPETTYYLKTFNLSANVILRFYNSSKQEISATNWIAAPTSGYVFTTPSMCTYLVFTFSENIDYSSNLTINYPATDTEYHPYQGNQISITFPSSAGTVYGGTLDVVSGLLTVNSLLWRTTWGAGTNSGTATDIRRRAFYPSINADLISRDEGKCNVAPTLRQLDVIGAYFIYATQFYITLPVDTPDSTAIELYYKTEQKQTYQLTPQQIATLLGSNNIYSDVGSIADVQYPADTKLYIDGKIAEAIANALNA